MKKPCNALPELLAPAGSPMALRAAVEGGADAVYLGLPAFNARIHAENFTNESLRESVKLAHAYGTRVYVTLNTAVCDRELSDFLRAAEEAYLCGADALIVADLGAASLLRRRVPLELHASTQMAGHHADAARLLAAHGFSRMVCAREMSREELRLLLRDSPIETEVFVHGALCVSHSGQCLFSSLVGGRSGNRGACAQPCRLPYRTPKGCTEYPLSLKDLSLARHVPELIEMGVASLKIEGRMKSPEYVRDVTRVFRRLLDEGRGADEADMDELLRAFSRGGFTDGYYTGRIDRKMLGVRSENDKEASRGLIPFSKIERKIPVSLSATLRSGEPCALTLTRSDTQASVTVTGATPQAALTAPLDAETVRRNLGKLGNTPFAAEELAVTLDDGLMLPISALNALRREAVEALMAEPVRSEKDFLVSDAEPKGQKGERPLAKPMRVAVCYHETRLPDDAFSFFDLVYTPVEHYDPRGRGVLLPPVIYERERESVRAALASAKERGATDVLVGNLGHLALARESGLCVHGDFRLNVTNSESARVLFGEGLADLCLSPELTLPQMRDVGGRTAAIVYGRVPLMVTEKCIGRELADCKACKSGVVRLTDRRGVQFPVLPTLGHRSLIFNSVPVYMADRQDALARAALSCHVFLFTDESPETIRGVIRAYRDGMPPNSTVRRM